MTVLITGATGFIGRHLCAHLTGEGATVMAMLRQPARQLPELRRAVDRLGGDGQLVVGIPGDLDAPELGLPMGLPDVEAIIHLGARFGWRLDPAVAQRTNVAGSLAVAKLARSLGCRLVFISGFMLENRAHLEKLGITSDDPEQVNWSQVYRRAGSYEASKLEAAIRVRAFAQHTGIDLVEVQPATVAGHSESGELDRAQPLYTLLDNLARGRMALVPGTPEHWLPLVPVDHLARLIALAAMAGEVPGRLLALDATTPNLRGLLTTAAHELGKRPPTRHIPMPILAALLSIPGVARIMNTPVETLHFIQPTRFETADQERFATEQGLRRSDITEVIRRTASFYAGLGGRTVSEPGNVS
ncbi:MAG: NAD-dependent epimerase/dehydratase family protein [Gammaproteobacteria bacterium]|nr:MAG: NAD-dependent epimerase/dehydratase family protein [Gammaproteobacteria bacterium]